MTPSRILVVEDENIVALDIEMRLIGLGYQVVGTADTGQRAIRLTMDEQPDLILMDINLRGEIDGVETAKQIQAERNIPIVFLTAYADDVTFGEAVKTELFGYILKPFDEKELHMAIEIALYRHKTEEKLRTAAAENKRLHGEVQLYANQLEERVEMRTAELVQANKRLSLILNSVKEGIIFFNRDSKIEYMNPAAEKITGYSAAQSLGKTGAIWRGITSDSTIQQLEQALAQGLAWQGDVINRREDGVLFDAALQLMPLVDADDNVQSFLCTQRDVSEMKELERLKARFVSRIGHELRTPLTNIHLYLDLLERGSAKNYHKYITILRHESKRLNKLIVGFLEISGLDMNTDPFELEQVAVAPLVVEVVSKQKDAFTDRSLTVQYLFSSDLPLAMADRSQLSRVLFHLVENATLYAPQNSEIMVETAVKTKQNRDWVTIAIRQTGTPISLDEQLVLFERFYRGESAMNWNIPGAGLGLAFCKESLEKQGGFITVTGNPDVGNIFTIWLASAPKPSEQV